MKISVIIISVIILFMVYYAIRWTRNASSENNNREMVYFLNSKTREIHKPGCTRVNKKGSKYFSITKKSIKDYNYNYTNCLKCGGLNHE
jgi:hypothetical protein